MLVILGFLVASSVATCRTTMHEGSVLLVGYKRSDTVPKGMH